MLYRNPLEVYGAFVWIFSAVVVFTYIGFAFNGYSLPGIEQLVAFLASIEGTYIFAAAFLSMFLEGLYFISSLFPGTTLVLLAAILSQVGGSEQFLFTIFSIFLGWCLAGGVNVLGARFGVASRISQSDSFVVKDRVLTTWFPAFRANYEVAQVLQGGKPLAVFFSSVRVKAYASVAAGAYALIIPFFIDVHEVSNEEGFVSLGVVGLITLIVGLFKLWRALGK